MNQSRRTFFKNAVGVIGAFTLLPAIKGFKWNDALAADAKLVSLKEDEPLAKTLGYHLDGAKVDVKKWPKKDGAEGKKQSCENCMFYTSVDKKTGKCQIFPNNTVNAKAWCNSWAKKA